MAEFEPKQFGKFFLLEKLAVGGMAEIYKAKTFGVDGFEKQLAIKRILPHCAADKDFIGMLIDEAKLSVLLSHANIVQVYDLGKVGDDYFISMEYINGANLRDLIYRCRELKKTMPVDIAVYIASEICKGLDYAHRKTDMNGNPLTLVHRDISPQNVLISYEGEVKIVDFGIAKAAMNISHTMAGILKGKIAYMSPEQALGKSVDHRTDIFSAGILLYECLTGEKLFSGESQFEVLKKIRSTKIDLSKLPTQIPKPLQVILSRALAYFPKDRFQSAGDMQIELTKYLYSTYHDFSPQKLAGIVREFFAKQIQHQKKLESMLSREVTGSLSVAQEALQEEIVHRDENGISSKQLPSILEDVKQLAEATEREGPSKTTLRRALMALGVVLAIAGGVGGYLRWIHPQLFPTVGTPQPLMGEAIVESDPNGATISIDGISTNQQTPARLSGLVVGKPYVIKLSRPGFLEIEQGLIVTSSQAPTSLRLTLATSSGILQINSAPSGADILLDGVATNKTTPSILTDVSLNVPHRITLRKTGFTDFEQPVTLTSTQLYNIDAVLQVGTPPSTPDTISTTVTPSAPEPSPPVEPEKPAPPPPVPVPPKEIPKKAAASITSTPSGAKIILDGRATELTTPAKIPDLELGSTHTVSLEKQGYKALKRRFTVSNERGVTVAATLLEEKAEKPIEEKKPPPVATTPIEPIKPEALKKEPKASTGGVGTIKLGSDPSGADVYINGELRGTTPATISNVPSGTVKVLVNKEGQARYSTSIQLSAGETKNLGSVSLGSIYGEVSVSSSPPHASVFLDGNNVGATTPVTIRKVKRDRPHTLKVILEGHAAWERAFTFGNDEEKKFNATLEPN